MNYPQVEGYMLHSGANLILKASDVVVCKNNPTIAFCRLVVHGYHGSRLDYITGYDSSYAVYRPDNPQHEPPAWFTTKPKEVGKRKLPLNPIFSRPLPLP